MSEPMPTDAYFRYQAMYYYMNERYAFASAIAQKDFKNREGKTPPIEQVHLAVDIAKRCEELVGIARQEWEDEKNAR